MRVFEKEFSSTCSPSMETVVVAEHFGNHFHRLLAQQLAQENSSLDSLQSEQFPIGFQIVGYDDIVPKAFEVAIGREVRTNDLTASGVFGCSFSGNQEVVKALVRLYNSKPNSMPQFHLFSLQDAVDYAKFIIRTTSDHQRFSPLNPDVGGDIDVAFITPFNGFRWIQQKHLLISLEDKRSENDYIPS